jgi:hypothetical protein
MDINFKNSHLCPLYCTGNAALVILFDHPVIRNPNACLTCYIFHMYRLLSLSSGVGDSGTLRKLFPNLSFSPGNRIPISCLINTCTIYHSLHFKQTGSKFYCFSTHSTKCLQTEDLYESAEHYRNYGYHQCDEYRRNVSCCRFDTNGTQPIAMSAPSTAWTVYARSDTGVVGSRRGYLSAFILCLYCLV